MGKNHAEGCWISLLLRLSMASLFAASAISKFTNGVEGVVGYFQSTFQETWIPISWVTLHARAVPYIEALIPIWLIVGWKLRLGWVFTGLFMISLAFGMSVAGKYDTAANNFFYVLFICAGLYFSRYDRLSLDAPGKKLD